MRIYKSQNICTNKLHVKSLAKCPQSSSLSYLTCSLLAQLHFRETQVYCEWVGQDSIWPRTNQNELSGGTN